MTTTAGPLKKPCILLVDDTQTALQHGRVLLAQLGFEVSIASSGAEGLALARAQQPDFVLLDVHMPSMDGIACCRQLRQSPSTRSLRVIMLTSEEDRKLVREAFAAGCGGYLTKPIDEKKLKAKLAELSRLSSARADLDGLVHGGTAPGRRGPGSAP
jgi:CheY-like chemotaxis protein